MFNFFFNSQIQLHDKRNISGKARKKKKSLRNLLRRKKNKTAPSTDGLSLPTKKEMKELMRSITLEDLIKNTQVQEDAIMAYKRPRRWPKKRPSTAPSKIEKKPRSEVQIHASQEGNAEETVVQINQQDHREETTVQINQGNNIDVQVNHEENKNETSTIVIEDIV